MRSRLSAIPIGQNSSTACSTMGFCPSMPALTPSGPRGLEAEIFLYDTLPGGAGFTSQLPEKAETLFRAALNLLRNCEGHCDSSCYRCLRSYKNKFEHGMLDRRLGGDLVAYLLDGTIPALAPDRVERSNDLLWKDLVRCGEPGVSFERDRTGLCARRRRYRCPNLGNPRRWIQIGNSPVRVVDSGLPNLGKRATTRR